MTTPPLPTPTSEDAERFNDLYEKDFGVRLEPAEARRMVAALIRFVYLVDMVPGPERSNGGKGVGDAEERRL